jgi:hypothetical protein
MESGNQGGYLNSKGELVLPFRNSEEYSFTNGSAVVYYHNKWQIINKKGDVISDYLKNPAFTFSEGLGLVQEPFWKGKYGFIS